MRKILLVFVLSFSANVSFCQTDSNSIKTEIRAYLSDLASPEMHGRGYVNNGRKKAADYISDKFKDFGLQPVPGSKTFRQSYSFPVNTFPGKLSLVLDGKELQPGRDYLVDASSASFRGEHIGLREEDLSKIDSKAELETTIAGFFKGKYVWYLKNVDSFCKKAGIRKRSFPELLPEGCFIICETGKQMWTVSGKQMKATVFYVNDTAMPPHIDFVSANVSAKLQKHAKSENIVAMVPGKIADSFLVFSAHYDHLGMMGRDATFCGASDNASGSAMLLYLAQYYATHPQRYSVVFMAFSGEEAGLLGSGYFVDHSMIPLDHIRFLTNVDIMGDATDGITAVNATVNPKEFELLKEINAGQGYLPVVKSRGEAANSDHYHFSGRGVPAFFIYSNGGMGYYHDVYDKAEAVTLNNVAGVAHLLIDFADKLQKADR